MGAWCLAADAITPSWFAPRRHPRSCMRDFLLPPPPSAACAQINSLLAPPNPRSLRALLSPFLNLTKLFLTMLADLRPHTDFLPAALQELHLTAGAPRIRFSASAVTKLTELR